MPWVKLKPLRWPMVVYKVAAEASRSMEAPEHDPWVTHEDLDRGTWFLFNDSAYWHFGWYNRPLSAHGVCGKAGNLPRKGYPLEHRYHIARDLVEAQDDRPGVDRCGACDDRLRELREEATA